MASATNRPRCALPRVVIACARGSPRARPRGPEAAPTTGPASPPGVASTGWTGRSACAWVDQRTQRRDKPAGRPHSLDRIQHLGEAGRLKNTPARGPPSNVDDHVRYHRGQDETVEQTPSDVHVDHEHRKGRPSRQARSTRLPPATGARRSPECRDSSTGDTSSTKFIRPCSSTWSGPRHSFGHKISAEPGRRS